MCSLVAGTSAEDWHPVVIFSARETCHLNWVSFVHTQHTWITPVAAASDPPGALVPGKTLKLISWWGLEWQHSVTSKMVFISYKELRDMNLPQLPRHKLENQSTTEAFYKALKYGFKET
eukprot:907115-Pyramimonas_sp.AAC.2